MTTKPRGPLDQWNPHARTRELVEDIKAVLAEVRPYWPVTVRAVYYRLLGTGKYAKGRALADRVSDHLSNARRAGEIPWNAIMDQNESWGPMPTAWDDADDYVDTVRRDATKIRVDRQAGQPVRLMVWAEARGMVQLLSSVAGDYGVQVLSTSGYDSTTIRHKIGVSTAYDGRRLVVLHVGDHDRDGRLIFRAAAEDVEAWALSVGGYVEFVRLAVTPEQIVEYALPDDPDHPGNVQVEAIPPEIMTSILRYAIEDNLDLDVYDEQVAREQAMRDDALQQLGGGLR